MAQANQDAPEYGPAKGTLVIVGGGNLTGSGINEKFIELAGGAEKNFVIVPTAGGNRNAQGQLIPYDEQRIIAPWIRLGLKNVRMLHTHDPKVADTEEFAKVLRTADAVWFNGGRQWNIVDSYANTLTYREFHKVLERGGVIGGSSAGATIQGEYLVRGDTSGPDVMMTAEPNHQEAFKFLRNAAIDQHINARNRWDHLDSRHSEVPEVPRPRPLGGHGGHRQRGQVRGDGRVEGRRPRQHAPLPALGEALLRPLGRRRLQHEDAQDRKVRHRSAARWYRHRAGRRAGEEVRHRPDAGGNRDARMAARPPTRRSAVIAPGSGAA